ncbi:MAG TPA: MmcQ/YjbR family DNA-binding protein [Kofleriaceae bacterium]|nr:MmcQ/YjbR family DNA-binding protein [Kofleriaceae bacterium]
MRWADLTRLGRELPEVEEDSWYGTPALKVRGKGFVRLKEDGKSVVFVLENVDEQEHLIEAQADIYYITDHYRGWPSVLARLARLRAPEARLRLERAWRRKAPRSLVARFDAGGATPAPRRRARPAGGSRTRAR